jgi:di/tricarboxylate transporter
MVEPRIDIARIPWDMILLVLGGNAMGKAVESSGLLLKISDILGSSISGMNVFAQHLILTLIVGVLSIFISHTVAALILIPLTVSIVGSENPYLEVIVYFNFIFIYLFIF